MAAGSSARPRPDAMPSQTPRKTVPTPRIVQQRPPALRPNVATPPLGPVTAPTQHIQPIRPR